MTRFAFPSCLPGARLLGSKLLAGAWFCLASLGLTSTQAQTLETTPSITTSAEAPLAVPAPDAAQLAVVPAAAAGACWNEPARWTGKAGSRETDVLNVIVCLAPGVSWSSVFQQLAALPGRHFKRLWPFPDYVAPWRQIYSPVQYPPVFPGSHCINPVTANVNRSGEQEQNFSAREGGCYLVSTFGRVIGNGGFNHFRAWTQQRSGALFVAASTEEFCLRSYIFPNHCVDSYNDGRNLLVNNLAAATRNGKWSFHSVSLKVMPSGTFTQDDGRKVNYDGNAYLVLIGF